MDSTDLRFTRARTFEAYKIVRDAYRAERDLTDKELVDITIHLSVSLATIKLEQKRRAS